MTQLDSLVDKPEIGRFTVVWTKKAVAKYDAHGTFDPRHTIKSYPIAHHSSWFRDDMQRKFGNSWIVLDDHGVFKRGD